MKYKVLSRVCYLFCKIKSNIFKLFWIHNINLEANLPGQGVKQALAVSVSLPGQLWPPFIGGGWLQSLDLLKTVPPDIPHVWEHCVHGPHWLQSPSRGVAIERQTEGTISLLICLENIRINFLVKVGLHPNVSALSEEKIADTWRESSDMSRIER